MNPTNREDFKQYCLRRLGAPVVGLNLDDAQVEDRIDEAINKFWNFHYDGCEEIYIHYQLQAQDITNNYISVPDNILSIDGIFMINGSNQINNMFNIRYQISLNDLYTLTYESLIPYYQAFQAIRQYEQLLVGQIPIRFNRLNGILYLDTQLGDRCNPGDYIIIKAYQLVDPNTYTTLWTDLWLQKYATALIKRQWGENISKYQGVKLIGGQVLNGDKIYDRAQAEIDKLEDELWSTFNAPGEIFTG